MLTKSRLVILLLIFILFLLYIFYRHYTEFTLLMKIEQSIRIQKTSSTSSEYRFKQSTLYWAVKLSIHQYNETNPKLPRGGVDSRPKICYLNVTNVIFLNIKRKLRLCFVHTIHVFLCYISIYSDIRSKIFNHNIWRTRHLFHNIIQTSNQLTPSHL